MPQESQHVPNTSFQTAPFLQYRFLKRHFNADRVMSFLFDRYIHPGRAIFVVDSIEDIYGDWLPEHNVISRFVARVRQRFLAMRSVDRADYFPKDFLLIAVGPGAHVFNDGWERVLGAPASRHHRIASWTKKIPVGPYYYEMLNGCEWVVWEVRSHWLPNRYLRIMQKVVGSGRTETGWGGEQSTFDRYDMAIHLQIMRD